MGTAATAPDPKSYDDELSQALAALTIFADEEGWASSLHLSNGLRDNHGIRIHWRSIDALFDQNLKFAARRKRGARWEYRLLAAGVKHLQSNNPQFLLIEPERALQGVRTVHAVFGALRGMIRLCDPYFDHTSIEHLSAIPQNVPVRVLTVNVQDSNKVKRHLAAARTEGRTIDVRTLPHGRLHDRYILDDSQFYILGTSLNGLGKKQSFLIAGGADIRAAMLASYEANWNGAAPWS